jgi:hypothetical protein
MNSNYRLAKGDEVRCWECHYVFWQWDEWMQQTEFSCIGNPIKHNYTCDRAERRGGSNG